MTRTDQALALKGLRFAAFGDQVTVEVGGPGANGVLEEAAARVTEVSEGLTRFNPVSELSRINADPRETVEASPLMIRFVEAAIKAAGMTNGLVDPTLLPELELAGYTRSMSGRKCRIQAPVSPSTATQVGGNPGPALGERWRTISVDRENGTLTRIPGVRLDAGGIGKGLAADLVAELMKEREVEAWSVDCLGDVRVGGAAGRPRPITIGSPFPGEDPIEIFEIRNAAIATSGTTRRSWTNTNGTTAHHLIDPRTGLPAEGDLLQVTAIAPTTVEAEARAKVALLSGLDQVERWLPRGGLAVDLEGRVSRFQPVHEAA